MKAVSDRSLPVVLLRDEILSWIKQAILSCELPPGVSIREQQFAEQFRVSKSPVRDALHRLVSEGLVEVLPRKGYRVRPVSLEDALELYEMRIVLEGACIDRLIRAASDFDLESLNVFKLSPPVQDIQQWIFHNRKFHITIATLCGNNRLAEATQAVMSAFDRLTYLSVSQLGHSNINRVGVFAQMDREHQEIILALQSRNSRRALALTQAHIGMSRERFLESYSSSPKVIATVQSRAPEIARCRNAPEIATGPRTSST